MSYQLPLRIRRASEAFVVTDALGIALAHVYVEDEESRGLITRRLCVSDGRAVAKRIARALTDSHSTAPHNGSAVLSKG